MLSKRYTPSTPIVLSLLVVFGHFGNHCGLRFSQARIFSSRISLSQKAAAGIETFIGEPGELLHEGTEDLELATGTSSAHTRTLTAWWDSWMDCNHGPQDNQEFAAEAVAAHNQFRQEVGVPDIQWSTVVAARAQKWADYLAENQLFEHSPEFQVGENIAMGSPTMSVTQATNLWGAEKKDFVYGTFPDVSATGNWADVGHYTQIVWRDTTFVGCGSATGADKFVRVVCQYTPNGNFRGQLPY